MPHKGVPRFEQKVPIPPKSEQKSPVIPIVPSVVPTQVPPEMQQTPSLGLTRDGPLSPHTSIPSVNVSPVSSVEADIPDFANLFHQVPIESIPPLAPQKVLLFKMIEALNAQFAESVVLQSDKNVFLSQQIDQGLLNIHVSQATMHDEILQIKDAFEKKFDDLSDFLKNTTQGAQRPTTSPLQQVSNEQNLNFSNIDTHAHIPQMTPIPIPSIPPSNSPSLPRSPLHMQNDSNRHLSFDPDDAPLFADQHSSILPRVRDSNYSITRSIAPIDPSISQVKLTELTARAVFIWGENMQIEQQKSPYEVLSWARYILRRITFHIQAMNNSMGLCQPIHLNGYVMILSNDQLWDVIVHLVRPQSTPEWIKVFNSLVKFTQLPQTYILDITRYDFLYTAMIEFEFLISRVLRFLDFRASDKFTPPLKSKDGKMGLMELIYSKMPGTLGIKLHHGISDSQIKDLKSIQEYLSFIMIQNQALYEDSRRTKVNRLKYEGSSPLTADGDVNQKINSSSGKFPYDVKLNYLNNLSPPPNSYMNPYSPIEKSDLPHQYHQFVKPEDTNRYNPMTDENVSDFDYFDAYTDTVNVENDILNPLYKQDIDILDRFQDPNEDPDQVSIDHIDSLHTIDISRMRTLPCFNAMMGVCKSPHCSYSHDRNLLSAAFEKRMAEMQASPFSKNPAHNPIFQPRRLDLDMKNAYHDQRRSIVPIIQPRRLDDQRRSVVSTPSSF
jgi:hypothetical protein